MTPIDASTLARHAGGVIAAGRGDVLASAVSTDTRTIPPGSAFFALRGDRFDANDFACQAIAAGASVAVVERWEGDCLEDTAVVQVPDGLAALQRFAAWYRRQREIPVVGITGSNGKTSTKDFTTAVLGRAFSVCATRGNLNNHIGVPLSVLSLEDSHTAAVFEMGMNHPGEIAPLCEIARPGLGIITNIGTAHIEYMGSRESIAEEKGALARSLPEDGALFIPAGCDFHDYFKRRTKARVICVGNGRGEIRAENLVTSESGSRFTLVISGKPAAEVDLPVAGRHMVTNALLAAGAGWFLGIDPEEIAAGLSGAVLTSGRLRRFTSGGVVVFDDTYNANPESMAAAIDTLAETPVRSGSGKRIAVLGRMGELGSHGPEAHLKVGRLAASRGLTVVAVGPGSEGIAEGAVTVEHFPDQAEAAAWLASHAVAGDVVLFKASRSAAMERVMQQAFPTQD
ncbi:UDP-N-acetylmuramoyl-tripeptide--D-alanyl-D-alanine ligase [Luteolibacter flavescens]|uniref:UDP-N-acetylmuramoyl-tripeptide--D-alanyl-D-alanine ligase n=1 Tax=Luteolibacter flavescens TaxID=1859460 RepID=A0ABT3FNB7_9BACT|nr:UDP-N-acetylmuramoyl-tripeptide--D-alanyl-D-alanine ligase [Luteolibacter flavescens]MCW1884834.1 UDP-N-acetylmuramoyl-tripeptide--D-alanyl-D-alanine ligase [Luteolibacter flavescens]